MIDWQLRWYRLLQCNWYIHGLTRCATLKCYTSYINNKGRFNTNKGELFSTFMIIFLVLDNNSSSKMNKSIFSKYLFIFKQLLLYLKYLNLALKMALTFSYSFCQVISKKLEVLLNHTFRQSDEKIRLPLLWLRPLLLKIAGRLLTPKLCTL